MEAQAIPNAALAVTVTVERSRAADRILALAARPSGYRPLKEGPWWAWLAPWLARRVIRELLTDGALVSRHDDRGEVLHRPELASIDAPSKPDRPRPDAAALRAALEPLALVAFRHAPNPVRPDVYRTVRVRLDLLRKAQTTLYGDMTLPEVWDALEKEREG